MAVSNIAPSVEYTGNGATTEFGFSFKIDDRTDVKLFIDDVAKIYTSDYTVNAVTSVLTVNTAPTVGTVVKLQRDTSLTRTVDYIEGGNLSSATLDADIDKTVMLIQDLKYRIDDLENRILILETP